MEMKSRIESDLLGEVELPAEAWYGAQTQRAVQNFPVGRQRTLGSFPIMVEAILLVKKATALANAQAQALTPQKAEAIQWAAEELICHPRPDQFPIHALHGGGGTSANMNANEVLANLAEEHLGGVRGEYRLIHPNEAVNLHQSTNDVIPTACHVAVVRAFPRLRAAMQGFIEALDAKSKETKDIMRLARTCYQDAVETTFGDFFSAYASFARRSLGRLASAVEALHAVNLGGTIVGRQEDAPASYREAVLPCLRQVTGDPAYHLAANLFDAAQNPDDLVNVSSQLDMLARGLVKIAQDVRVLSSGPEGGLGELELEAVQPGSSIMPGKVNPVIPEFLIQACFRVMGNHAACAAALDHGELDLNVWESTLIFNILDSLELLETGLQAFTDKCVKSLRVDVQISAAHASSLMPRLTKLMHRHGYAAVSAVCKQAQGDLERLKSHLRERFGD